jgi:transposase
LFITGSLRQLVPDDHVLARIDRVLDLSWLRGEVGEFYCTDNGRPGIDPEVAVRLMLAGFLLGIVHDRRLMREAQVNIAIRWFVGYALHEVLPDHSSLTRIRQRWGPERFRQIFQRTVQACVAAGIAKGEVVHADASLIRADVSWESLAVRHVDAVAAENADIDQAAAMPQRNGKRTGKHKKVCVTDPDATMATSARNRRLEPSYKQHGVVDDLCGVVLDVEVTTGEVNEGQELLARLDATVETTGAAIRAATADAGYAYAKVFAGLEARDIEAIIPTKAEPIRSPVPLRRFRYDAKHDHVKCPRGKILRPNKARIDHGRFFASKARDCKGCDLASICLSPSRVTKAVVIVHDYPALLRARRRRQRWGEAENGLYRRHRWRSEGFHGEAKTWHGLARALRRGLDNMKIQSYLTAAAINLKRLAAAVLATRFRFSGSTMRSWRHRSSIEPQRTTKSVAMTFSVGAHPAPFDLTDKGHTTGFFNRPVVHFYRNVFSHVPSTKVREVAHMLKAIHAQESRAAASRKAGEVTDKLKAMRLGKAAALVEAHIEESFSFYAFPDQHWIKLKTNNPLERIMREIRRRTRVVGAFPDGQSCLNLAAARLRHIAGSQWSTRKYMNMVPLYAEQTSTNGAVT